jgi:hypothetical protein
LTPQEFITLWKDNPLTERAGAQGYFDDLCDLLGVKRPRDPDSYCFERGAQKSGGGDGWADVWKRGCFGWESKKPGRDLKAALKQLTDYALALESPLLLIVSDRERIEIHKAFPGYPDDAETIFIDELADEGIRERLRWVFTEPVKLRPEKSTAAITAEAAGQFAELAKSMRLRGIDGQQVAHFLVQCLFAMFAEDERLLPEGIFTRLLEKAGADVGKASDRIRKLFKAMQEKGGEYGDDDIPWFNGGLFNTIQIPPLTQTDLHTLHHAAADMDWRAIDPTIFGTLFERGLDPKARAPLGAHYTDTGTIQKLIRPLITEPLLRAWAEAKASIEKEKAKKKGQPSRPYQTFLHRLNTFRVLDPACGSGNFLYLALAALRDVEKHAHVEAESLGLGAALTSDTGPHNILGLEINEFAAELARVTVWIGDIQWCRRNGYRHATNPILKPLDGIEHRDALLQHVGWESEAHPNNEPASEHNRPMLGNAALTQPTKVAEAEWPTADVVVGNPPFLGGSKKRGELGADYFDALNAVYADAVPGGADLVCYWFHKARKQILAGKLQAAGLVATNSIRGGANRAVLDAIVNDTCIFEAWSDEPWVNEGAAVRVSLIGFGDQGTEGRGDRPRSPVVDQGKRATEAVAPTIKDMYRLDGREVAAIHADLTAGEGVDLTQARTLAENAAAWAYGSQEKGDFAVDTATVLAMLATPNPHGKPNSQVIRRSVNARQIVHRRESTWVIDFGLDMPEDEACLYEKPFAIVQRQVAPKRLAGNDKSQAKRWWLHARPSPKYRTALAALPRLIVTPCVSKHRLFVFLGADELADHQLTVIARSDDATFGILHSRFHELWALRLGTSLEDRPRYTPSTTFETFPFPQGFTPRDTVGAPREAPLPTDGHSPHDENHAAIAAAARKLNALRENWLNPSEWVDWVITLEEEKAGFPARPVAKPGHEADLKKRTLTNLYNARPAWLDMAHKALDKAVAAAYGWTDYSPEMPDDEILRRLLALNLARNA